MRWLKLISEKLLKNFVIKTNPTTADITVGIKIDSLVPRKWYDAKKAIRSVSGFTIWFTKILYFKILKAWVANDDINVKTEKGRLSANILITIIKKLSSLSKLFTINSAEQNKIIRAG